MFTFYLPSFPTVPFIHVNGGWAATTFVLEACPLAAGEFLIYVAM